MNPIAYFILGMFCIDIFFTYFNVMRYRDLFPKKDYTNMELNPLVKYLWKTLGLFYGGIIATIVQIFIIFMVVTFFNSDLLLILFGIYLVVVVIHIDNFVLIREKKRIRERRPKKRTKVWRVLIVILLILISFTDLALTYHYVDSYKSWRPDVPYDKMEANPLLLFAWNHLGLLLGTILSGFIIWFLLILVGYKAHWLIIAIVLIALSLGVVNNINHINMLNDLIIKYSTGHI